MNWSWGLFFSSVSCRELSFVGVALQRKNAFVAERCALDYIHCLANSFLLTHQSQEAFKAIRSVGATARWRYRLVRRLLSYGIWWSAVSKGLLSVCVFVNIFSRFSVSDCVGEHGYCVWKKSASTCKLCFASLFFAQPLGGLISEPCNAHANRFPHTCLTTDKEKVFRCLLDKDCLLDKRIRKKSFVAWKNVSLLVFTFLKCIMTLRYLTDSNKAKKAGLTMINISSQLFNAEFDNFTRKFPQFIFDQFHYFQIISGNLLHTLQILY